MHFVPTWLCEFRKLSASLHATLSPQYDRGGCRLQVGVLQGWERRHRLGHTAAGVQRVCLKRNMLGGNVEDTVSSRLHGNHISFTDEEAEQHPHFV